MDPLIDIVQYVSFKLQSFCLLGVACDGHVRVLGSCVFYSGQYFLVYAVIMYTGWTGSIQEMTRVAGQICFFEEKGDNTWSVDVVLLGNDQPFMSHTPLVLSVLCVVCCVRSMLLRSREVCAPAMLCPLSDVYVPPPTAAKSPPVVQTASGDGVSSHKCCTQGRHTNDAPKNGGVGTVSRRTFRKRTRLQRQRR